MRKVVYLMIALTLAGCGSVQNASTVANPQAKKNAVIKAHKASRTDFYTLKSKMSVRYEDDKQSRSVSVELRMQQGEKIWMSVRFVGFTAAKLLVTPDRVQFYEKLTNTSFDGDFTLISDFLGEPLNYQQLEDLLLGQAVESLQSKDFIIADNSYQFLQGEIVKKLFKIRPDYFKLKEQSISKESEESYLLITYPEYQKIDGKFLPKDISLDAQRRGKRSQIDFSLKRVSFDEELSFPFSFPSNTKPLEL